MDATPFFEDATSLEEVLSRISQNIAPGGHHILFYGFIVNMRAVRENDFVFVYNDPDLFEGPDPKQVFQDIGGTANDIVAPRLPGITAPFAIDLPDLGKQMEAAKDPRLTFVELLLTAGLRTCWIVPFHAEWIGGFGVLNQFFAKRHAKLTLPPEGAMQLAESFHDTARKSGFLAKHLGITPLERRTLQMCAQGMSAREIAEEDNVGQNAVAARIANARQKLKADSLPAAIFKGVLYGALPFGN